MSRTEHSDRDDRPAVDGARRRRRPWYVRLLFVGVVLVIALLLVEGGLALTGKGTPRRRNYVGEHENGERETFVADADLGWRMRPDHEFRWTIEGRESTYRADAAGFRVSGRDDPEAPDTPYVALTGDSYMWGTGVDWDESCAGRIAATGRFRVRNFAMPGYGIDQISLAARLHALPTDPDVLVVAPFLNDFDRSFSAFRKTEGFTKPLFALTDGELVRQTADDRPNALYRAVEGHSRIFGLWRRAQRGVGLKQGVGDWWELNAALLETVRDTCSERGTELLIVHIPNRWGTPFPALQRAAGRWGAGYIGLDEMTEEERRTHYFEVDGHLNARGHAYLARRITSWLDAR